MTSSRLPFVAVAFALSVTTQCSCETDSGLTTELNDAGGGGDTTVPDTAVSTTTVHDAGGPDATVTTAAVLDADVLDAAVAATTVSDGDVSDAAVPDSGAAASDMSDAAVPTDAGDLLAEDCEELAKQLEFLIASQRVEGLVSSSTFENSTAAMALLLCGKVHEAERIFLAFAAGGDPLPAGVNTCDPTLLPDDATAWSNCACDGGFRQFRSLEPPNVPEGQFWIGDDAFLLMALEFYRNVIPVSADPAVGEHVDSLREQLKDWFLCIGQQTRQFSQEGIHAGYCDNGALKGEGGRCFGDEGWVIELHAEGSIDVYGALRSFENMEPAVAELRSAIKAWLDVHVWQPTDSCYERGSDNETNLAADHISWGVMSLMPEEPEYACLLEAYGNSVRRSFTGGVIENWSANSWAESHPNISTTSLDSNSLVVSWDWGADPSAQPWFLVNRRVCLPVSNTFEYCFDFETEVDEAQSLEIKFSPAGDAVSGQYDERIPDMSSIPDGELCVTYADLEGLGGAAPAAEGAFLGLLEVAVNANLAEVPSPAPGSIRVGEITYSDEVAVEGFAGIEDESDRIFVAGTAAMAAAYCLAGEEDEYQQYLAQLEGWMLPAAVGGMGPPSEIRPSTSGACVASVDATAWYVIAKKCFNPFFGETGTPE